MRFFGLLLLTATALAAVVPTSTVTEPISTNITAPVTEKLTMMGTVKCETSMASPLISDINQVIDALISRGGRCWQNNQFDFGSWCTNLVTRGTADVSICGAHGWLLCTEMARGIKEVRNRCKWNNRAGGIWDFNDTPLNAVLHSH